MALDHALGVGEVERPPRVVVAAGRGLPGQQDAEGERLVGELLVVVLGREHRPQLVDGDSTQGPWPGCAVRPRPGHRAWWCAAPGPPPTAGWPGAGSGGGGRRPAARAGRGRTGQEQVGLDLGHAHAGQDLLAPQRRSRWASVRPPVAPGRGRRRLVVAPAPGHLLLQVGPQLQVEPPAQGDGQDRAAVADLGPAAEAAQVAGGELGVGRGAEAPRGAAPVEPDGLTLPRAERSRPAA